MGRTRTGKSLFFLSFVVAACALVSAPGCGSDDSPAAVAPQEAGVGGNAKGGAGGATSGGAGSSSGGVHQSGGGTNGSGGSSSGGASGSTGGHDGGTTLSTGGAPVGGSGGTSGGGASGGTGGSPTGGSAGTGGGGTDGGTGGSPTGGTAGTGGTPSGGTDGGSDASTGGTTGSGGSSGGTAGTGGQVIIGTPDGGPDSGDGGPEAGVMRPPRGSLWNDGVISSNTGILVCFTTAPHIEWNGKQRCDAQVSPDLACSGDVLAGDDVASLRDAFMSLLQDTWARATNLEFYSYDCPTSGGVVDMSQLPGHFAVTFTTKGTDPEPVTQDVTGVGKHDFAADLHVDWKGLLARDPETLRDILRESGRMLGFPYEWLRGDEAGAPNACPANYTKDPEADFIARPGSLVDYFSVMDRCTPTSSTQPGLSPGDAIGAQQMYGTKQNSGLVGYRAYCAAVGASNANPGSTVIGFPCRRAPYDSFCRCSQSVPRFEAYFSNVQRCLSVSGNAVSTGFTQVLSDVCDDTLDGQKLPATNLEWRAMGNMCLAANNGQIELAVCDGSAAQQWNFFEADLSTSLAYDQIQQASTGECVTTQTQAGDYGEHLTLAPCDSSDPRQHFQLKGDGFIGYGSAPWCLDVLGGQPTPGASLGLWDGCNNLPYYNSQFYISGKFKSLGQCLAFQDQPGGFPNLGVEPCRTGSRREVWDFHF